MAITQTTTPDYWLSKFDFYRSPPYWHKVIGASVPKE